MFQWFINFFRGLTFERIGGLKPIDSRDGRWPKLRNDLLTKRPFCAICNNKKKQYLTVHHIKPFHLFPELELDWNNLLNVCESPGLNCHLYFCHFGSWSKWNPNILKEIPTIRKLLGKDEKDFIIK